MYSEIYAWGVDGLGRQAVCHRNGRHVLMCALPGCSVLDCIDMLAAQFDTPNEIELAALYAN